MRSLVYQINRTTIYSCCISWIWYIDTLQWISNRCAVSRRRYWVAERWDDSARAPPGRTRPTTHRSLWACVSLTDCSTMSPYVSSITLISISAMHSVWAFVSLWLRPLLSLMYGICVIKRLVWHIFLSHRKFPSFVCTSWMTRLRWLATLI